jgi:hypothetical protein
MDFFDFLRQHNALSEDDLKQPKLGEWAKKYCEVYPIEQQEKDLLDEMARHRWIDAEQVLESVRKRGMKHPQISQISQIHTAETNLCNL